MHYFCPCAPVNMNGGPSKGIQSQSALQHMKGPPHPRTHINISQVQDPCPQLINGPITKHRTILTGDPLIHHPLHPIRIGDRKSTRLNSSHVAISYAVFCLKNKKMKTE